MIKQHLVEIPPDGFIRLVDVMGDDKSIVEAARVSYYRPDGGDSGNKMQKSDAQLLRYLMRNLHETPFEMCEMKFVVRCPMDVWRQWIRHRTANVNEYSTRYSVAIDSAAMTEPGLWRRQSKTNKQGSSDYFDPKSGVDLSHEEEELHEHSRRVYENRLDRGVAREQARKDLPLSTYTQSIWKCDLRNIFNFLRLRMDSHAQFEIRQFANAMSEMVRDAFPVSYRAFEDYILYSMKLSLWETMVTHLLCLADYSGAVSESTVQMTKSERRDFVEKLKKLLPVEAVQRYVRELDAKEGLIDELQSQVADLEAL